MLKLKTEVSLLALGLVSNLVGMDPQKTNLPPSWKMNSSIQGTTSPSPFPGLNLPPLPESNLSPLAASNPSPLPESNPSPLFGTNSQQSLIEDLVKLYTSSETDKNVQAQLLNNLLNDNLKYSEDLWEKLTKNPIILFILNELAGCKLTIQPSENKKTVVALQISDEKKETVVNALLNLFRNEKVKNAFLSLLLNNKDVTEDSDNENSLYFSIAQDVTNLKGIDDRAWNHYNEEIKKVCKEIAIFESLPQIFFTVACRFMEEPPFFDENCKTQRCALTSNLKELLKAREEKIINTLNSKFSNDNALKNVFLKNHTNPEDALSLKNVQTFIEIVNEVQSKSPKEMLAEMQKSQDKLFLNIVNTLNEQEEHKVWELYSVFKALDKFEEKIASNLELKKNNFGKVTKKAIAALEEAEKVAKEAEKVAKEADDAIKEAAEKVAKEADDAIKEAAEKVVKEATALKIAAKKVTKKAIAAAQKAAAAAETAVAAAQKARTSAKKTDDAQKAAALKEAVAALKTAAAALKEAAAAAVKEAIAAPQYKKYMENLIINLSFVKDLEKNDLYKSLFLSIQEDGTKNSFENMSFFCNVQKKLKDLNKDLNGQKQYLINHERLVNELRGSLLVDKKALNKDDAFMNDEDENSTNCVSLLYQCCVAYECSGGYKFYENRKKKVFQESVKNLVKETIENFYKAKIDELYKIDSRLKNIEVFLSEALPEEKFNFISNVKETAFLKGDDEQKLEYIRKFADSEGQKSNQKVLAVSQFLRLKDIAQELNVNYSSVLFDLCIICARAVAADCCASQSQRLRDDMAIQSFESGANFVDSILCESKNLDEEEKLKYIQKSNLNAANVFFKLKTISDKNKRIYQFKYKQHLDAVCEAVIYSCLEEEKKGIEDLLSLEIRKLKDALNEKCHFNFQSLKFEDLDPIESFFENLKTVDDKTLDEWKNFSKTMSSEMNGFFDMLKNCTAKKGGVKPLSNEFSSLDLLVLYNECVKSKTDFQQEIINNLIDYLTKELSAEPFVVLNKLLEEMLEGCESFQDKVNSIEKFLSLRVNDHVSKLDEEDVSVNNLCNHAKKHFLPNQPVEEIEINRNDIFDKAGHAGTMITGFGGDKDLYISMTNLWNDLSNLQCNPPMYFYETPERNSESLKSFRVQREYKLNKDKLIEGGYIISQSHFIDAILKNNTVSVTEYEVNSCTIIRTVEQVSLDIDGNFTVVPITFFFKPDYTTQLSMTQKSSIATDLEKKLNSQPPRNSTQKTDLKNSRAKVLEKKLNPNAEEWKPSQTTENSTQQPVYNYLQGYPYFQPQQVILIDGEVSLAAGPGGIYPPLIYYSCGR